MTETDLRHSLALIALDVALGTLSPTQGVHLIRHNWLDLWSGEDCETLRDACKLSALWVLAAKSPLDTPPEIG